MKAMKKVWTPDQLCDGGECRYKGPSLGLKFPRRTWGTLKPVTRVKGSKKVYRRDNRPPAE